MNTPSITPIETQYNGYRFRSRLEARWAVFFDTVKVRWDYEKEGYALQNGWYLPDFWLPFFDDAGQMKHYPAGNPSYSGLWVEIKAGPPTDEEILKIEDLSHLTQHCTYLVCGTPGDPECVAWKMHFSWDHAQKIPFAYFLFYLEEGRSFSSSAPSLFAVDDDINFYPHPAAVKAFSRAKSFRFERGA